MYIYIYEKKKKKNSERKTIFKNRYDKKKID